MAQTAKVVWIGVAVFGIQAVYMHGDLCSVRNGSCVYAGRLVFNEELKLCKCMETCVQ